MSYTQFTNPTWPWLRVGDQIMVPHRGGHSIHAVVIEPMFLYADVFLSRVVRR